MSKKEGKKSQGRKSIFVNYALIAGLALGVLLVGGAWVLDLVGENPVGRFELPIVLLSYFLVLLGSMLHFRLRIGELEGWRSITMGLLTNFIAASIYALGLYFLFESSDTALQIFKRDSLAVLERFSEQASEKVISKQDLTILKSEIQAQKAGAVAFDKFLKISGIGLFITFLAVLFARFFPVRSVNRF